MLLQIVDTAWKDHLLAMDYLRSAVGLKGWAQMDPKVEYKREGMRLFEQVWQSIGERVHRPGAEAWNSSMKASSVKPSPKLQPFTTRSPRRQRYRACSSRPPSKAVKGEKKIEPIRNRGEQVKRNDPCPCNSGKKYKNCCMRNRGVA